MIGLPVESTTTPESRAPVTRASGISTPATSWDTPTATGFAPEACGLPGKYVEV
jgi:hypothetical protein